MHIHTYLHTYIHTYIHRWRKFAKDLEGRLKEHENTIKALEHELNLKETDIQHYQHHVTELKDLLSTSVQEKSKEKRLGKWFGSLVFVSGAMNNILSQLHV